ncbi:hypothetical protein D3C87_2135540 [compost metagenome]
MRLEAGLRTRAIDDFRTGLFSQIDMSGNKVRMKMGLKNIPDFSADFLRFLNIGSYFAQRIDHRGFAI